MVTKDHIEGISADAKSVNLLKKVMLDPQTWTGLVEGIPRQETKSTSIAPVPYQPVF